MLPVVLALKDHPDCRKLVPAHLWKYFDEPLLISGWYPERDYWVLIEALVKSIDPRQLGGDVWRYFATFSAQRDIGGQELKAAPGDTASNKGVYRTYSSGDAADPASFFGRVVRLWSQYHDSGRLEISGGRRDINAVMMRLIGFVIPLEGFVRLQGYYLEEYGRLVGFELTSSVTRSTALGDPFCEWEHRLARTPASQAYVASLPALTP
ncbi:MAG TPA: hypothetical protein VK509_23240 [Polyangiales bacterium]|nr:hypothetical protein [Polyangiales bacterium]